VPILPLFLVTLAEDRLCKLAGFTLLMRLGIDPRSDVGRGLLCCTADTRSGGVCKLSSPTPSVAEYFRY
jgi:hypothetical protein